MSKGGLPRLRHVSVFVDETKPGHYHRVLHEATEDITVWFNIETSRQPFSTWAAAWKSGLLALHRHIGDPLRGPRVGDDSEGESPSA
jgi:hypothetical protein